jgi:hypothetical protein
MGAELEKPAERLRRLHSLIRSSHRYKKFQVSYRLPRFFLCGFSLEMVPVVGRILLRATA